MIVNGEGRFVLLSKPAAFPFTDIVNNTPEGPVFDLSVDLEFFNGVAYLKAEHVEEMARTLGMEYKKEAEPISAEINHDLESLLNGIDAVTRAYRPLTSAVAVPSIAIPEYLKDPEPESPKSDSADFPESAGIGQHPASGTDKPNGKDSKPSVDKGPTKLPASTDDGFNF